MRLYNTTSRSIEEIEKDLAKAKSKIYSNEVTGQHIFYNIPVGDAYKKLVIEDFEWELRLAKIRDSRK